MVLRKKQAQIDWRQTFKLKEEIYMKTNSTADLKESIIKKLLNANELSTFSQTRWMCYQHYKLHAT